MLRLGLLFVRLLLLLLTLAFLGLFAAQSLAELMGETTIAEGYRQVAEQVPGWPDLLVSTPWWITAIVAAIPALLLIWPSRHGSRGEPGARQALVEAEAVEVGPTSFVTIRKAAPAPYLKEQHIYAGSAKLSLNPEFRAIPARYISHAKVFIEYSAYSTEDHSWGDMRRVLVAEIHGQEADEWSVLNVELMTFYESPSGRKTWRWAREFDYGPPADEDYLFTIEDHYHGRVVFVGPDETAQHFYFAVVPAKDAPSDMPNLVSHGLFDFVAEWEAQDREEALTI